MANNQYVNKVEYEGQTLMDLTNDTISPSDVLSGVTFHDRSGTPQQGNLITHDVYDGLDSDSTSDALSAKQGKNLANAIANKAVIKTKTFSMESPADCIRLENWGISRANFINAFVTSANNIACVPYAYSQYGYIRFVNSNTMAVASGTYSGIIIYYE